MLTENFKEFAKKHFIKSDINQAGFKVLYFDNGSKLTIVPRGKTAYYIQAETENVFTPCYMDSLDVKKQTIQLLTTIWDIDFLNDLIDGRNK